MLASTIAQRFEVIKHLGGGGMAQVYLARDVQTEARVAVKILNTEHVNRSRSIERFRREGRLLCQLHHPNLVSGICTGDHEGRPYIVMEYIDGPSIADLIAKRGHLGLLEALKLLLDVALALDHLHVKGAVQAHRDIKPTNILIGSGTAKVTDFGIAKALTEDESVTMTSSFLGSPHYMSPEQITDPRHADIRSDIYALGAVFYEMVTGEKAFPGRGTKEILDAHFELDAPQVEEKSEMHRHCNLVLARTLAPDVCDRFQNPRDLVEYVAPLVGSDVTVSVPRLPRNSMKLAAALVVAAVLAGGILLAAASDPAATQENGGSNARDVSSGKPTATVAQPADPNPNEDPVVDTEFVSGESGEKAYESWRRITGDD